MISSSMSFRHEHYFRGPHSSVCMRALTVSRHIAILSAGFVVVLVTGSLSYIGGPVQMDGTLLVDRSAILAFVSPLVNSYPIPSTDILSQCITTSGLASSLVTWIPSARNVVHTEQEVILAERDAFGQFRKRVTALHPSSVSSTPPTHDQEYSQSLNVDSSPSTTDELDDIYQAYRDMVLSTPHYDDDYGEPLIQNMALEFGEEITTAMSANSQLTPEIQHAVVQAATAATKRRIVFNTQLEEEEATLNEADQTLTTTVEQYEQVTERPYQQQSVDDLRDTRTQLTTCIETCEQLLEERQIQRTDKYTAEPHTDDIIDLQQYLYHPLDVTYPILVDGTVVLERCTTARRRVEDVLIRRL